MHTYMNCFTLNVIWHIIGVLTIATRCGRRSEFFLLPFIIFLVQVNSGGLLLVYGVVNPKDGTLVLKKRLHVCNGQKTSTPLKSCFSPIMSFRYYYHQYYFCFFFTTKYHYLYWKKRYYNNQIISICIENHALQSAKDWLSIWHVFL